MLTLTPVAKLCSTAYHQYPAQKANNVALLKFREMKEDPRWYDENEKSKEAQKANWKTLAATYVVGFGLLFLASEPFMPAVDDRRNGSTECDCKTGGYSATRGSLKRCGHRH